MISLDTRGEIIYYWDMEATHMKTISIPADLLLKALPSIKIAVQHGCYIAEAAPAYDVDVMAELLSLMIEESNRVK